MNNKVGPASANVPRVQNVTYPRFSSANDKMEPWSMVWSRYQQSSHSSISEPLGCMEPWATISRIWLKRRSMCLVRFILPDCLITAIVERLSSNKTAASFEENPTQTRNCEPRESLSLQCASRPAPRK